MMERDGAEDIGVDGRIILEWVLKELERGGVDWALLAQTGRVLGPL